MRETGYICDVKEGKAVLELTAGGGCKNCALNGVCTTSGSDTRKLELPFGVLDLKRGDLVEIETSPRSRITAAFLVFIFPLILSFIAYELVYAWSGRSGLGLTAFFICFVLAELILALFDRLAGRGIFFQPRIVRKVGKADAENH